MDIRLLLNGEAIDERLSAEPDVDNFDETDDSGSTVGEASADSSFDSASDTSGETGTDSDDWETFGEENEADAFEDTSATSTADDPFDDDTVTAEEDPFASNDTADNATATTLDDNETNDTATPEECDPVEEEDTITSTNDTTNTTNTTDTTDETVDESTFPATSSGSAQVVFADQEENQNPPSVIVESATLPDSGFVVIHNESMMEGEVRDSMIGVSEKLDAERSDDIRVGLTPTDGIDETQTLYAVLYRDGDDDGEFEYDGTTDSPDQPYLDEEGSAIFDNANVTVPGTEDTEQADTDAFENEDDSTTAASEDVFAETRTATETEAPNASANAQDTSTVGTPSTPMSGNAAEEATQTNAPGFGMGVAIVALLGMVLLATRRS